MDSKMMPKEPFCKNCIIGLPDDLAMNDEELLTNEVTKRVHKEKHPFYHLHHKSCSCSHEKRLVDLGKDYFPRLHYFT